MATVSTNSIIPSVPRATIDDLYLVEGKAELIDGKVIRFEPSGDLPSAVAGEIMFALHAQAKQSQLGVVLGGTVAFALPKPLNSGRQSFSPDASYYVGPLPANRMRFIDGAPTFAVEVRSEGDYTPAAEREIAAKRADYFEAGTLVVWDVDPKAQTIRAYPASAPTQATVFRAGDMASAEPAVPGWTVAVAEFFAG